MINKEEILAELDAINGRALIDRIDHKERVIKALDWWEKYSEYSNTKYGFVGLLCMINGVNCLCTRVNLLYPFAYFEVRPRSVEEDAGSGAGMMHKIQFYND